MHVLFNRRLEFV